MRGEPLEDGAVVLLDGRPYLLRMDRQISDGASLRAREPQPRGTGSMPRRRARARRRPAPGLSAPLYR
jgi:hypothetical protein